MIGKQAVILWCLLALGTHSSAQAQDLPDDVGVNLDGLGFSDDLFAQVEDTTPDWLQPFTFRLSQQLFAQTHPHRVPVAGGGEREKNAYIENQRLSLLTRYQNPFAPGWLMQASAQVKLYGPGDYEYRANGSRIDSEFRLNEFFVQRSEGDTSVKLGAQTVVWGENIGNSVLDVINTSEFRDPTIIDIEDARLNQWMLVRDRYHGNHKWSSFLNLYPEFNPPPVRGSPFFFEPAFNLTDYQRDKPLFEVGTQMRWTLEGSDISVMAAYLYENQLHYSAPPSGTGDALSEAGDYLLLGFSANRAIGRLLLNLDVAYSHDILVDVLQANGNDIGTVAVRKLGGTAGFEYAIDNEQNLMLGVTAETLLREDEAMQAGQQLLSDRNTGNALLRYSNNLRNGDLLLSVTMQSALDTASMLGSVALQYTLSNHLTLTTQAIATRADRDTALASLDRDLRLGMTLSWTF